MQEQHFEQGSFEVETERIPGVRPDHTKVVLLIPGRDTVALQLPEGVSGHVYRIVNGVAHVNLQVELPRNAVAPRH